MAIIKSCIVSLAISAVWFVLGYAQFGALQGGRVCDNVVFVLYLLVLWYLFSKQQKEYK